MTLRFDGAKSLDSERFKKIPKTYVLATAVREETEAQRVDEGGSTKGAAGHTLAQVMSAGFMFAPADEKHWFEFLTDRAVLQRCSAKLNIGLVPLIARITDELQPPNWEVFFWMRAFLQQTAKAIDASTVAEERAKEFATEERSRFAKRAANMGHAFNKNRKSKAIAWYFENRHMLSKNGAAIEIAKTHSVSPVTARDWLKSL